MQTHLYPRAALKSHATVGLSPLQDKHLSFATKGILGLKCREKNGELTLVRLNPREKIYTEKSAEVNAEPVDLRCSHSHVNLADHFIFSPLYFVFPRVLFQSRSKRFLAP